MRLARLGKLVVGGLVSLVALAFALSSCSPKGMGEDDIVAETTRGMPADWHVIGSDEIESAGVCIDGCDAEVDIEIATPRATPARIRAELRTWLGSRDWDYSTWDVDNWHPLGCSFGITFGEAAEPDDSNDRHGIFDLIPRQESPERLVLNVRKGAGT